MGPGGGRGRARPGERGGGRAGGGARAQTRYSLPPVSPAITQGAPALTDTVAAMLDGEVNRQALMIVYLDDFHLMMIITCWRSRWSCCCTSRDGRPAARRQ